jgi:hypothetical protein
MVGRELCVFVGAEVKTKTGRLRPAQEDFHEAAHKLGAIVGVVRSPEDYEKLLEDNKLL